MSRYFVIGVSLMALLLTACSNIKVATIPPPHPTAKLRIYVQVVSERKPGGAWGTSPKEFSEKQVSSIEKILEESGIYEVVSDDDREAALGEQQLARWELERGNWALARQIAGALHAGLCANRGTGHQHAKEFLL